MFLMINDCIHYEDLGFDVIVLNLGCMATKVLKACGVLQAILKKINFSDQWIWGSIIHYRNKLLRQSQSWV